MGRNCSVRHAGSRLSRITRAITFPFRSVGWILFTWKGLLAFHRRDYRRFRHLVIRAHRLWPEMAACGPFNLTFRCCDPTRCDVSSEGLNAIEMTLNDIEREDPEADGLVDARAALYMARGDYSKALDLLQASSACDSGKGTFLWGKRGDCYYAQGDYAKAHEAYAKYVDASREPDPKCETSVWRDPSGKIQRIVGIAAMQERWDEVVQWTEGLDIEPFAGTYPISMRAQALSRLGRTKEAVSLCRSAADRFPEEGVLWEALGLALLDDREPAEAAKALQHAITLGNNRDSVHKALANAKELAPSAAIDLEVTKIQSEHPNALLHEWPRFVTPYLKMKFYSLLTLALLCLIVRARRLAAACFRQVTRYALACPTAFSRADALLAPWLPPTDLDVLIEYASDPKSTRYAQQRLAERCRRLGCLTMAVRAFQAQKERTGKDFRTMRDLGDCLFLLRRFPEAREAYLAAYACFPRDTVVVRALVQLDSQANDWHAMIEHADALIGLIPDDLQCRLRKATAYTQLALHDNAIAIINDVLQRSPDHVEALVGLGWTLVLAGRYEEAIEHLEAAKARGVCTPEIEEVIEDAKEALDDEDDDDD